MPRFLERRILKWGIRFLYIAIPVTAVYLFLRPLLFFVAIAAQDEHHSGKDPRATVFQKTGLTIPASAIIGDFTYTTGLDDYLSIRFDLPEKEANSFLRQPPFGKSWAKSLESQDGGMFLEPPKPPFQIASVELPNARYMKALAKEGKAGRRTIWIVWFET